MKFTLEQTDFSKTRLSQTPNASESREFIRPAKTRPTKTEKKICQNLEILLWYISPDTNERTVSKVQKQKCVNENPFIFFQNKK